MHAANPRGVEQFWAGSACSFRKLAVEAHEQRGHHARQGLPCGHAPRRLCVTVCLLCALTHRPRRSDKKGKKGGAGAAPAASGPVPTLDAFEAEELAAAAAVLRKEAEYVRGAMGHGELALEEYEAVWQAVHKDLIYVPSKGRYERLASATNTERLEALKVRDGGGGCGCGCLWEGGCASCMREL